MRLSELTGVEIINLADASRLGYVIEVDAELWPEEDRIRGLRLTVRQGWWWGRRQEILWESIRRIGRDLIIVEIPPDRPAGWVKEEREAKKRPDPRVIRRKSAAGRGI